MRREHRPSSPKRRQSCLIETLELRQLLAVDPWGAFPQLIHQDVLAATHPALTGAGETIAILDTGIDYNHPDLGGGFGPGYKVVGGYDFVSNDADPMDYDGHGTAVAAMAAGNRFTYGGYAYQGIAPDANLVALRIDDGSENIPDSRYEAALQWVIANRTKYNIVAVNISEGGNTAFLDKTTTNSIYSDELATLKAAGVFIAAASGNEFATLGQGIEYPSADPSVYSAGAINSSDQVSSFTSRSEILDLLAPGENVPAAYITLGGQPTYVAATGTSFSSPVMAASAALLRQVGNFTPDQMISILRDSGVGRYDSVTRMTFPRVDLSAAITLAEKLAGGTAAPSPFSGTPLSLPGTLQAENFDQGGEGVAYHDTDHFNDGGAYRGTGIDLEASSDTGGGYNVGWMQAGEWLKYTTKIASDGTYTLSARVAAYGNGGTFHIEVDGANVTGSMAVPNTGDWQKWQTVSKSGINLAAGQHIIRFVVDSNGQYGFFGNLNWVQFTAQAQIKPTPFYGTPLAVPGTIQAEDFDNGGEGVAYHDTETTNYGGKYRSTGVDIESSTDSGGGYDVGWIQAGEWMVYSVNIAQADTYTIDTRVASAALGGAFHIEVDGVNVTGAMGIPNTGGWQNWQTLSKSGVSLSAGTHLVRFVADSNGASGFLGNVNWLRFTQQVAPPPPSPLPWGGTPAPIPGRIEAENFDTGGEGVSYHDATAANEGGAYRSTGVDIESTTDSGGGYDVGWLQAGEWMNYTVNVTASGTYTLDARVACYGTGGTFHVEVDGVNVTGSMAVPNTGGWQTWKTVSKAGVALTAGQHTLRFVADSNGQYGYVGNVNWLNLSAPPASTPFSGTPIALPGTVQAENFDNGGEGVAYHDTEATNLGGAYRSTGVDLQTTTDSGGGYAVGFIKAGEWLNYTVNVAAAGTYTFDARVASGGAGGTFHLEVDGVNVTGSMTIINTGGWQTWQTVSKTGVALSAGQHVMRLVFDTNGATGYTGNLNWFRFA